MFTSTYLANKPKIDLAFHALSANIIGLDFSTLFFTVT
jgi:hypothetical protein